MARVNFIIFIFMFYSPVKVLPFKTFLHIISILHISNFTCHINSLSIGKSKIKEFNAFLSTIILCNKLFRKFKTFVNVVFVNLQFCITSFSVANAELQIVIRPEDKLGWKRKMLWYEILNTYRYSIHYVLYVALSNTT